MKLLTINTHSLIEENYPRKLLEFVKAISIEKPDIIAMQEVNQSVDKKAVSNLKRYVPCDSLAVIREDNHVYNAALCLKDYFWTWLPIKNGYSKFDEGIALMSRSPIIKTDVLTVSGICDYNNWKTRKLVGICTEEYPGEMFYSVHYGWWNDTQEPFEKQWKNTVSHLPKDKTVWLMGDFNNPSDVRNEGYDLIKKSGWYDSASEEYFTAHSKIDGWNSDKDTGMRIDFIFCKKKQNFLYSKPIFDGKNYSVISDHFGVYAETAF